MKSNTLLFTAALALVATAPLAHAEDKHPAYLHALSDLRDARAQIEKPNRASGTWDEKAAIREIDAAIKEIKAASIDDGKNLDDHPPVDAKLEWGGRLKHAEELLASAYADVHEHEDDRFSRGLKARALEHISAADELLKTGIADANAGAGGGGDHPAYLHALADLRDARAHLEKPSNVRTSWEPHKTVAAIDEAIREIKAAAIDDGKNIDDHVAIDANLDWGGRVKHTRELLQAAYDDIDQHEDNQAVHGLKKRALKDIRYAIDMVEKGAKVKWEMAH
jgi:hypothetical protein